MLLPCLHLSLLVVGPENLHGLISTLGLVLHALGVLGHRLDLGVHVVHLPDHEGEDAAHHDAMMPMNHAELKKLLVSATAFDTTFLATSLAPCA